MYSLSKEETRKHDKKTLVKNKKKDKLEKCMYNMTNFLLLPNNNKKFMILNPRLTSRLCTQRLSKLLKLTLTPVWVRQETLR